MDRLRFWELSRKHFQVVRQASDLDDDGMSVEVVSDTRIWNLEGIHVARDTFASPETIVVENHNSSSDHAGPDVFQDIFGGSIGVYIDMAEFNLLDLFLRGQVIWENASKDPEIAGLDLA